MPPRHADAPVPNADPSDPSADPPQASGPRGVGAESGRVPEKHEMVSGRVPDRDGVATVHLEAVFWDQLTEIARREGMFVNEVCLRVALERGDDDPAGALRAYVVDYLRADLQRRQAAEALRADAPPTGGTPAA